MKEAADVLAESREYIETHGWCRGRMQWEDGSVCSMGAIAYSQHWNNVTLSPREMVMFQKVCSLLTTLIQNESQVPGVSIPFWNDVVAKDQQEVLDMFMKAEKIARSGNVEES